MGIAKSKEIAILAITVTGAELGRKLKERLGKEQNQPGDCFVATLLAKTARKNPSGIDLYLPEKLALPGTAENVFNDSLKGAISQVFAEYKYIVLIMATGIAVRLIAPLLKDKHSDPAIVVVDDGGKFAISLLSGHVGGANQFARKVAAAIGAEPVITTASEVMVTVPADILGREFGWEIEDDKYLTAVSAALVNGEPVGIYQDAGESNFWPLNLPENIRWFTSLEDLARSRPQAALIITDRILTEDTFSKLPEYTVVYRPRSLVVGIGCNRDTASNVIEEAVNTVFAQYGLSTKSIKNLATIDIKRDEPGLLEFARNHNLEVNYFDKDDLSRANYPSPASETAMKEVGTPAVCESAALLSSRGKIIIPKTSHRRAVTIAAARILFEVSVAPHPGKVYLVGTGPGQAGQMTLKAREAIDESEVVVGYNSYVKLIAPLLREKEVISTGMGGEIERVKNGFDLAGKGRTVSVISSGDAGVYGMAGLMGELLKEYPDSGIEISVIPGVPALAASAALLGAPLTNDFACISLSDHLVPWEKIGERLECAARGDFVIVLYNPRSRQRPLQLAEAREIILRYRPASTKVGIVTNAYREEQQVKITDLEHLLDCEVNMNTTVIVGNSMTFVVNNWMVTPRGYREKYKDL